MTEKEWMCCRDARLMMQHLTHCNYAPRTPGKELISARKLRLLGVAICRTERVRKLFVYRNMSDAIKAAEEYSDGMISKSEYREAVFNVGDLSQCLSFSMVGAYDRGCNGAERFRGTVDELHRRVIPIGFIADLLRDFVGNPFRPPITYKGSWIWTDKEGYVDPRGCNPVRWLNCEISPQIHSLAMAAYEQRLEDGSLDQVRLSVLADALEEAGCDCGELLQSLRGVGIDHPRYRGQWALDVVMGTN